MEKTVTVTQRNFKHIREQYGIRLKDVADICNLSPQTVNSFEKCRGEYTQINARSYNGDNMIAALQNMVNEKIKNSEKTEEKVAKKHNYTPRITDVDRRLFTERLKNYLFSNHIKIEEFCKMCEISEVSFQTWYITRNPKMSKKALNNIIKATGWTYDDIKTGSFVLTKGEKTMSYVPDRKSQMNVEQKTDKKNVRYICDESGFYVEYDILQHVKQSITKEMFIKAVSEEV